MNPIAGDNRSLRQLKKLQLLESIDDARWESIAPHVSFRDLDEGDVLFSAGGQSENLYLVLDGELGLYLPGPSGEEVLYLHSRHRGDTAGDFAVLNGGLHIVSGIAARKTRVATFPIFAFELLTGIDPDILAHVYDTAAELSRRVTLARAFLELFGDITVQTMNALLEVTTIRHYRSGELLFSEGDDPDGLYVVVSGRLSVSTQNSNGETVLLGEARAPTTVGELGVLSGSPRNADVYTTRESTVAFLDREQFDRLIGERPHMLLSLARLITRRSVEQARDRQVRAADSNFVIIPLDSRMPVRRFLQQLKRHLRRHGNTLLLDSRGVDTLYGKTGAAQTAFDDRFNSAIAEWLDDKENRYSQLLYLTDTEWSEWTKRCIHRADRILLLANADHGNDASVRDIERRLALTHTQSRSHPPLELVLLHAADTRQPEGSGRWLDVRRLDAYHHVRIDDARHTARLARRLLGRARGIVLSGGGARGYAHLGVQRLIEEIGLDIDYIGGSSMGGLLGASMAMGESSQTILNLSQRFANKRALFDYTLPVAALMKSAKLTHFCQEVYGDRRIEDLWIPFFCVSSDLHSGEEVIHDRGELWRVVRGTIALPGVFTPLPAPKGRLLIDGAVLNTFPVDVMYKRLAGRGDLIGVNVSQLEDIVEHYDYGTCISGWRALFSRINPFMQRMIVPRIAETLLRSTDIKSIVRLNEMRSLLNILIEPDVSQIALLDFKRFAEISDIGYQEAKRILIEQGLIGELQTVSATTPEDRAVPSVREAGQRAMASLPQADGPGLGRDM